MANEGMIDSIMAEDESYSNDDLFNISSWGADPSIRELVQAYEEDDILKPELQRKYVWDEKEASRFIESILLGLPVPSIFLANRPNGKRLIVDGYQRIMTVFYFMKNRWAGTDKEFRLYHTELINERWRGKTFSELNDDDKRRFKTYTIHAIVFEQKQPKSDSALYQIFERINTSGKALNAQEIRNCVYQGGMNTLLQDLNKNEDWRIYCGEEEDKRMLDIELILRYFALYELYKNKLDTANSFVLKKVMNDYMRERITLTEEDKGQLFDNFTNTIHFVLENIGEDAFFNVQNDLVTLRKKLYPTIWDSIMVATTIALESGVINTRDLHDRRLSLLKDENYREYIAQGTMRKSSIKGRIDKALQFLYDIEVGGHE